MVKPTSEELLAAVLRAAREIGQAWRGDWADFDGRTLRDEMDDLIHVAQGAWTVERYREMHGLCPHGKGQWKHFCSDYCTEEEV